MKQLGRGLVVFAIITAFCTVATEHVNAAIVTRNITGEVTQFVDHLPWTPNQAAGWLTQGISLGTPMHATLSYHTEDVPNIDARTMLSITVGGLAFDQGDKLGGYQIDFRDGNLIAFYYVGVTGSYPQTPYETFNFNYHLDNGDYTFATLMSLSNGQVYELKGTWEFTDAPAVPIPAAVWLFGTGLVGLVALKRRRSA